MSHPTQHSMNQSDALVTISPTAVEQWLSQAGVERSDLVRVNKTWLVAQAGHGESAGQGHAGALSGPQQTATQHEGAAGGHGAVADGHEGGGHGAESQKYLMPHEIPNIATLIESAVNPKMAQPHGGVRPHPSETVFGVIPINSLFAIFYAIMIVWVVKKALRRPEVERPGKLQNAIEALLGGLRNFFIGIMGHVGEKYVPFVGSLWLFIWINNLMSLIPGLKAPTSSFKLTFALGLTTFCYVQYHAIRESGFGGWIYHLLGSPKDAVTWCLAPLFFFLELIGELVKPVSLSLRLFGNIFGEDKLLASFLGMGMMIGAAVLGTPHPIVGVPIHVIFFPLVVLTSTIQATVFALLASIYIVLLLPHEEHEHEEPEHIEHTGPEVSQPSDSVAGAAQV